ncbi:ABC transporter ATP-binding protein [Photobacterium sp. SDRW27]|uniref:ABC transporter ATP-binding protein n=1 Tax=Photobacterium obscurum TaxID=2829490 RepID=UPI00224336DD|nr:ABC transporter ATP-binding protein [Photobacterium obscurum]MCW8331241.1 ABC transporter ATP-binding protein [Photobacterium obscurum]
MDILIKAERLGKSYQQHQALSDVSFELRAGQVLALLGHNGAGKSTLIKSILGVQAFDGKLEVFGLNPQKDRVKIVSELAYISDVAVLPEWMKVGQIIKYMAGVHPAFDRNKAESYLQDTDIKPTSKIASLSKGMKVQLHLAIVMATDAKVLILDEPTLGLDLMYRDKFYNSLMAWFKSGERALIIASHEVAEIEHLLTDVLILKQGKAVLNASSSDIAARFSSVTVSNDKLDDALALNPIMSKQRGTDHVVVYEDEKRKMLEPLGQVESAKLADIFLAKQQEVVL